MYVLYSIQYCMYYKINSVERTLYKYTYEQEKYLEGHIQLVNRRNSRREEWWKETVDSCVAFYCGVTLQIYLNVCKFYNVGRGQGERINITE